jgi:DNA adenine methylase
MHENFNHEKLFQVLNKRKNWIMTYNNCDYIRDLYKNYEIREVKWSYGMNTSKDSSEIVILG